MKNLLTPTIVRPAAGRQAGLLVTIASKALQECHAPHSNWVLELQSQITPCTAIFNRDRCSHLHTPCRYYVKAVKKPRDRASIALAVRIGSVVEEEHERGVAHIVEHL